VRGQRYAPAAHYPRERPGTHCTGGWVGLRAGLEWCGKFHPTGIRSPDRPARLRYPAHPLLTNICVNSSTKGKIPVLSGWFLCHGASLSVVCCTEYR